MLAIPATQHLSFLIVLVKMAVSSFLFCFPSSLFTYTDTHSVAWQWDGSGTRHESSCFFCRSFFPNKWIACGCWTCMTCSLWFRRWDGHLVDCSFASFLFGGFYFGNMYYSARDSLISWLMWHITKKPQSSRAWTKKKYIFSAWGLSDKGNRSNNLAETVPNKDELNKRSENWTLSKLPFLASVYCTSLWWNI